MNIPFTSGKQYFKELKIPIVFKKNEYSFSLKDNDNFFTVIFAIQGSGILRIKDKPRSFITPLVFCIPEGVEVELIHEEELEFYSIYFHPSFINDALSPENIGAIFIKSFDSPEHDSWLLKQLFPRSKDTIHQINIGPASMYRIKLLFSEMDSQFNVQSDEFWPCRGRSYFIELLILLERLLYKYDPFIDDFPQSKELEDIYPVILHLNNNYSEKITVTELAKKFNSNRTTLTEKFLKATGYTPINYLIKLRIRIAGVLLLDTSIPISEIIERIGFDDLTNFGKMFKKYKGFSPSFYREKFQIPAYIRN